MVNALLNCYACAALVSEENEEAIIVPADRRGKYIVGSTRSTARRTSTATCRPA